jgi:hypothetical protein
VVFDTMPDMAKAYRKGDLMACNPAIYPLGTIAGIVYMPLGFAIGLTSQDAENHYCGGPS